MKIIDIDIHNYRNLDGIKITFSDECNFIVGENNLGKSNFLSLLNILFSRRSFNRDDFNDITKPIEVNIKLKLADIEIGHFKDLFETTDYSIINIVCKQLEPDDYIDYSHLETKTYIPPQLIRWANYVHYDSLRSPISEINFDRGRGVGRFLNSLIAQYLKDNKVTDQDFLEPTKVEALIKSINDRLSKVKSFKDFAISAMPDDNLESLLCKLVILKDDKGGSLSQSGSGIQYLILVTLSILEKIQSIVQQRKDKGIFQDIKTGKSSISLILGFDEPEIHLHPYMQRSLIKYVCAILKGQNSDFSLLVKDLFGIDNFIGQIFVVTQSPNIILNDFQQIVRFYFSNSDTDVVSGANLNLNAQLRKHLYLNFPFIKEAFFARCAIFVEGDSEYSCLSLLAQKLNPPVNFDDLGICVIQARGNAVPQLIELSTIFKIPSVGITDKDTGMSKPILPNHFQTNLKDFEEELVATTDEATLRKIILEYDPYGVNRVMQSSLLNKWAFKHYSLVSSEYTSDLKLSDIPLTDKVNLKAFYLTWFSHNKSFPLGKAIGETLCEREVPAPYRTLVNEALKLVSNA